MILVSVFKHVFRRMFICRVLFAYGTNIYDFHLVTILVLDDFGEGVPVAWLVSNREDAAVLRQFLLKVKERCGDIKTEVFMSDDADNFYNAWKSVYCG